MKRISAIIIVMAVLLSSAFANGELYLRPNFAVTYDTNVFSDPLPKHDDFGFVKRTGLGFFFDADYFPSSDGRTGLSVSFLYSHIIDNWTKIVGDNADGYHDWIFSKDPDLFFALGPMFRAKVGPVGLGIALRASVGSINLFTDSVNLGLQVEPFIMVPLGTDSWQLSAGLLYDAHLYDFFLHNEEQYYRSPYFLLTVGGYIGIAYRWGV